MPTKMTRTPIEVKRGKGGTGGDHVPTKEGLLQHLDYERQLVSKYSTELAEWSLKEKRANQHWKGHASHPEFRGMTALHLSRFIAEAEGQFWVCNQQLQYHLQEIARIEKLLYK